MKNPFHNKAIGIWQLQKSMAFESDDKNETNDTYTFIFHKNDAVTVRLLTLNLNQWKSEDDFYKLSTKWDGDTLYYLPPFGDWRKLAVFDNDEFIIVGNGIKRIFKLIAEDEIIDWNENILNYRELHDYNIKANLKENEK